MPVTLISAPPALAWLADIQIAAGGGGDQVARVDVRSVEAARALDVGERKIECAGVMGLPPASPGAWPLDAAAAAEHERAAGSTSAASFSKP